MATAVRPGPARVPSSMVDVGRAVAVALLVFGSSYAAARLLRDSASGMVAWWPATGIAVALLVRSPRSRWWQLLAGVGVANAASNLSVGWSSRAAAAYLVANVLEAAVTAHLLVGRRSPGELLHDAADAVRLALGAALGVSLATGVVALRVLSEGGDLVDPVRGYATAHVLGLVMVAPPLLLLPSGGQLLRELRDWGRDAEWLVQLAVSTALAAGVFCLDVHLPLAFLLLMPLLWGAARLGTLRALLSFLVAAAIATQGTLSGYGPFTLVPDPLHRLLVLQLLLITSAVVVLLTVLAARSRDRAHDQVVRREELFRRTFDDALLGVALLELRPDGDARIVRLNPAGVRMLAGSGAQPVVEGQWNDWVAPEDAPAFRSAVQALVADPSGHWRAELRHTVGDTDRYLELALAAWPGDDGVLRGVLQVADVTARRELEQRLRGLALHDSLTGLPNRALLSDRLGHALAASRRSGRPVALLYLDLDGFKQVNDAAGHASGDELLVQVGERLRDAVRPGDTVARLGGDEFVVVCTDVGDVADAQVVASRVMARLREPFLLDTGSATVGVSVGITLSRPGTGPQELLREADEAMYRAKRSGKDRVHVAAAQDQAQAARVSRVSAELGDALDRGELVLHGQPVCELATGRVVAVETLLRWQHPTRGLLPPAEFLDVAEAGPLMLRLGRLALEGSCRMAVEWAARLGDAAPDVHVNVSGRQLEAGSFCGEVLTALQDTGLPAERLVLELTETHVPVIADSLLRDLERLRARGARLAVDDLGTGYSSLTRITELPVDVLKVDRRFVAGVGSDPASGAVVRAVLGMGAALGLSVVAEGVETVEQSELLSSWGCTAAQGYLFSRPLPPEALLEHLTAQLAPTAA